MKKMIATTILLTIFCNAYPQDNEWVKKSPMPTPRHGMCSVIYEDMIWIIGGEDSDGNILNSVECYLPFEDRWESNIPPLSHGRSNAAAVVYEDKIFVIGGRDKENRALRSVEYFSSETNTWKLAADMNIAREALTAVVLHNTMFAIGGFSIDATNLSDVEYWDATNGKWEFYPSWTLSHPRVSMVTVVVNEAAYTLGGTYFGPVSFVERFSLALGTEVLASMPNPRFNFAAVAVEDTIFVIGGNSTTEVASTVDKYVTTTDAWMAEKRQTNIGRSGLTAEYFGNMLFIFGGTDYNGEVLDIVECIKIGTEATTVVEQNLSLPQEFQLLQNYPNPFNNHTVIPINISNNFSTQSLQLDITNIHGRIIKSFHLADLSAGTHRLVWNGRDSSGENVASGIYFYRLKNNEKLLTSKKMMLLR
jgi:hypothetical protein